ncbi:MAG TPA: GNAT family N-acetyltransferase [Thermoplasmata archaeon]|nr:GNAT family N-acetyltransferase [Thermoplasmata archaeon]
MPTAPGRFVPLASATAEALAFLERIRQEPGVASTTPPVLAEWAASLRGGTAEGLLWKGPADDPLALVLLRRSPLGVRIRLLPAAGFRSARSLGALLTELEGEAGLSPLLSVEIVEVSPEPADLAPSFESAGFYYLGRRDLEFPAGAPLPELPPPAGPPPRPVTGRDHSALARLMDRAYTTDPYDRILFAQEGDPAQDAAASIDAIVGGRYGPFLGPASSVIGDGATLQAAVLCVENDGGLIAELLVDPDFQRRGLGRFLLARAITALRAAGHRPRLVYTGPNRPAEALYLSFGFRPPEPPFVGGVWVHLGRLGKPELARELSRPRPGSTVAAPGPGAG